MDIRKGLVFCAALAAGEALAFAFPLWAANTRIVCAVAALFATLCAWGWRRWSLFLVACALFGFARAGQILAGQQRVFARAQLWNKGAPLEATFTIPERQTVWPAAAGGMNMTFRSAIGPVPVNVRLSGLDADALPRTGERWRCAGWLAVDKPAWGGRYDYRVRGRGSFARRLAPADEGAFSARIRRLRQALSRRLGWGVAPDREAVRLVRAILLGERANLPRETRDAFADAGTIHVFAISGLHVMVVTQLLSVLLVLLYIPERVAGLVLIPLIWVYVLLTGGNPSAMRAACMASLYVTAPVFGRAPNGLIAWIVTFFAAHVWDPTLLQDIGSRLSFVVVLTLILAVRATQAYGAGPRLIILTLATWAVGVPLVAASFGRFTFGGLIANLVLVPAAECAVIVASAGLVVGCLSATLAAYFNNLAALMTDIMSNISFLAAALPGAHGTTPPWPWYACILWYFALGGGLWLVAHYGACRTARLDLAGEE